MMYENDKLVIVVILRTMGSEHLGGTCGRGRPISANYAHCGKYFNLCPLKMKF